jgi:ubiquinol-cytochrome c reductase subunit 6
MAEEEIVDPMPTLREECKMACPKQLKLYEGCVQRITEKNEGDCESWFIELISCADKCAAPKLFKMTRGG